MTQPAEDAPFGTHGTSGIMHRRSNFSVADTVRGLTESIERAGAKLFVVVDHSGEAEQAGLSLRDTKLLIFGNPIAGTPVMQAVPLAALDLPLKVLVWADDAGSVWMSYLSGAWLGERHGIPSDLAKPLAATDALTRHLATSG